MLLGAKIASCSPEETFGNLTSRFQEQFSERKVKRQQALSPQGVAGCSSMLCSGEQFNRRSIGFRLADTEIIGRVTFFLLTGHRGPYLPSI